MSKKQKQEPVNQQEAANTAKGLIGDFNGVQTFEAKTGTRYGIIAEANGLTLSLAPKIAPSMGFIGIYTRVRIQKKEDWANLDDGPALFGFPEMTQKSDQHMSCEAFVAVSLQPCTPFQVGKLIEENQILESLVGAINSRVEGAGQKLVLPVDAMTMYLRNVFETVLPSEQPKAITTFPVCIGDDAIGNHVKALYEEFGKKKPKQHPEHPPGAEGPNPD
jgi:hypothetical protein